MYNDTTSSSLGVPYDYGSMMHYSKTAFSKGNEPTIVTNIPAFSDVIGQRMEFSDSDLLKLHRLYNCSKKCWISMITCLSYKILWHLMLIQYLISSWKEKATKEADKQNSPLMCNYFMADQRATIVCVVFLKCLPAGGSTFLDSCDFERENICGMIQGQEDKADWVRVASAAGGPHTDFSNLGKCAGEYTQHHKSF